MIALLVWGILAQVAVADEPRPGPWPPEGYACLRAESPIVVDGRLDDADWARAPWTNAFVDIEGDRRPRPRLATRAKMLHDDAYFYVAAELEEPHLWGTLTERDAIIYYDNDFEVFLDPDGDSHLYTEVEINALGTVWDLLLVRPYRDGGPAIHAWDIPGLKSAVHLDGSLNDPTDTDRGWSVEIAIPFSVLAETTDAACPPRPGDRWRVNFSRVQWKLDATADGYQKSIDPATGRPFPEDNWVWSPQREIAMHEPEHWGIVEFRISDPEPPVRAGVAEAVAWHLRNSSYRLAAWREEHGRYPETFDPGPPDAAGPELTEAFEWPPSYRSDGIRYTLSTTDGATTLRLTEDGRLTVEPGD